MKQAKHLLKAKYCPRVLSRRQKRTNIHVILTFELPHDLDI